MTFSERFEEIRTGFERPFWVANSSELFERLSYYASFSVLAVYLRDGLHFSTEQASNLTGMFGGWVWVFAVLGGAVADKLGFRRALSVAYLLLSIAYFTIGSINAAWMAPLRNLIPLTSLVGMVLWLPALGVALVKPSVVGTTARSSKENVRSVGYSIYYTLVNIGSTFGPLLASWAVGHGATSRVFQIAAVSVFLMFFFVLVFFREPHREVQAEAPSLAQVGRNFLTVLTNPRFLLFLLIFSGYWIVFWQEFIAMPLYVTAYIDAKADTARLLAVDPLVVICFTVLIGLLTKRIQAFSAIVLGTLISSLAWILIAFHPSVWMTVAALVGVAIGEIVQQPRYYDYVSRLAPADQQGTYMGFAFLPLGLGSFIAGRFNGWAMHRFGEVEHRPELVWWSVAAVGIATTALLWIYDRFLRQEAATA